MEIQLIPISGDHAEMLDYMKEFHQVIHDMFTIPKEMLMQDEQCAQQAKQPEQSISEKLVQLRERHRGRVSSNRHDLVEFQGELSAFVHEVKRREKELIAEKNTAVRDFHQADARARALAVALDEINDIAGPHKPIDSFESTAQTFKRIIAERDRANGILGRPNSAAALMDENTKLRKEVAEIRKRLAKVYEAAMGE